MYARIQCMHAKLLQSCLSLHNPMDCSHPDSSVHGILQARILVWVAISFRIEYNGISQISKRKISQPAVLNPDNLSQPTQIKHLQISKTEFTTHRLSETKLLKNIYIHIYIYIFLQNYQSPKDLHFLSFPIIFESCCLPSKEFSFQNS